MKDFRVVSAKVLLNVSRVVPIRNFLPVSILVVGEQLDKTSEVTYNGIQVEQFIVQAKDRMIVRVPDAQVKRPLRELAVMADVNVAQADAVVTLSLPRPLKMVEGIDRLVQSWMLVFMTTPGSDIFTPNSGGGARSIIGRSTDRAHANVSASLALAIERTKNEILKSQAKTPGLPLSERMLSCTLDRIYFDSKTSVLNAQVSLSNMLGRSAQVSLG
jgi:hypothetical protein